MKEHKITKGFDIRLAGAAERKVVAAPEPLVVAVAATDFRGLKPKVLVKEGDKVRTGDPLFFDKKDRDTLYLSPATGKVANIVFGKRRQLHRVEVSPERDDEFAEIPHVAAESLRSIPRDELVAAIKQAGLWPLIRQRPLGRTARADKIPSAIYVNGMDTEPLAADPVFCVEGKHAELVAGVDLLRALTDGPVRLTVGPGPLPAELDKLEEIEVHRFSGPHPAGLVGTHIHEIAPLRADQVAWYLKAPEVVLLGEWVLTGRFPTHRTVAVAGSEAPVRQYFRVRNGAALMTMTGGKPLGPDVRVIAGTVLNGTAVGGEGFLGFRTWTVTAIPDGGDRRDLFGWALPQVGKLSASRAVASWLAPKPAYDADARLNGGRRPFVNIGTWEAMTPLDIHPTYLLRAIQAGDLDEAINLGLLEVTEEDVALCTFADPCKIEAGEIVRKGLDLFEAES